jgi:NADPH:quinone reductase-like Zn-dependent oxidoreductase
LDRDSEFQDSQRLLLPDTMRAVQFTRTGGPEVLELVEVTRPEPGPTEALVAVAACGVNRADILARSGALPFPLPLPHILGADVVGYVVAKGGEAGGPEIGTRVVVNAYLGCGVCEFCEAGRNDICPDSVVLGLQRSGGYADYVVVPAAELIPLPPALTNEQAVHLPVAGLTAWHMVLNRGAFQPGDDVLVIGATSGVGSIAVQVARIAGAKRVFATVGSESKRRHAEELGCDVVLLHTAPDFGKQIRAMTHGRGVDIVLDYVGAATWKGSTTAVARGGRIVVSGAHSGFDVGLQLATLSAKEYSVIGAYGGTRSELRRLLDAAARGVVPPVIGGVFPLAEAPRAHELLESRRQFGKIVLDVSG